MIKYAKLNLPIDIETLKIETSRILQDSAWLPHFNKIYYDGNWEVFSLRSPGGKSDRVIPELMNESAYEDTSLMLQFSSVKKFITNLNCPVMSVRLLNLKAGSVIKAHRDIELCFEKGEARIHLPVFTNSGVEFFIDEERIVMKEGDCWYINANRMHKVSNNSTFDRIHLIIDCKVNAWLENIFEDAEKVSINEEVNRDETLKIIHQLKLQNTETSNQLAEQLLKTIQ